MRRRTIEVTLGLVLLGAGVASAATEDARTFKAQGDGLVQRGKADEAIAAYENAVRADPDWLVAHDALAASRFAAGQYDKVIAGLKPIVDKHADYANGWYSLGYSYRKTGKNAESVDAYQRLIKLRPDDAEAYYGLGRAALALGKKEDAVAALTRYVAIEKRVSEQRWVEKAKTDLAELEKAGVKATPADAKAEAGSPGERTCTTKAAALADQADAARAKRLFKKAYDLYQKARAVDGSSTRAYDGLGETGLVIQQYGEMIPLFRVAVADNPGYAAGYYYLGRALREGRQDEQAVEALRRCTALLPTFPDAQLHLGLLLVRRGDKEGGIKALQKYLEVENRPGQEVARKDATNALKELGAGPK